MGRSLDRPEDRSVGSAVGRTSRIALCFGVVAAISFSLITATSASAGNPIDVPSSGKFIRAWASWEVPGRAGREIEIEINQRETLEGEIHTRVSVVKMRCHMDGDFKVCSSYASAKVRQVTFTYDPLLTTATAVMETASGKIMRARWDTQIDVPELGMTEQGCGPNSGLAFFGDRPAISQGRLFGVRLRASEPGYAGLSIGAESTDCA